MSFLFEPGDLAQTPLAAMLLEALNLKSTGVLSVQHGAGTSKLFFRSGVPVGAQVVVGFRPLGQALLAKGLIDIQALDRSLQEMARTHRSQGELLVEMGAISQEALDRALAEQQAEYVGLIAALETGGYRFDPSEAVPEWTRGVRLSPLRAIVQALETPQAEALLVSALRQAATHPVKLGPGYSQVEASFGWSQAESAQVGRLARPIGVDEFFVDLAIPPERARAALAALLLLELAGSAGGSESAAEPADAVVDMSDLLEPAAAPVAGPSPPGRTTLVDYPAPQSPAPPSAAGPAAPSRRSDPAEARARRQRLLARAMQNMGIGPFSSGRPAGPAAAGGSSAAPGSAAAAPEAPRRDSGQEPPRAARTAAEAELRRLVAESAPRARERDYFARLGLDRSAGSAKVKQAYLALAKQFHPDRFVGSAMADLMPTVRELFSAINEAYEVLSDDKKRADYLAAASAAAAAGPGSGASEAAALDFKKGESCLKSRDFPRARGFFEAALRQDPRAEYQAALAWCHLMDPAKPDRERAKELLAEATKDPSCARAFYVAGVIAREEGDEERTEQLFRTALKANPNHLEAEREVRLIEMRRNKKGGPPPKKR